MSGFNSNPNINIFVPQSGFHAGAANAILFSQGEALSELEKKMVAQEERVNGFVALLTALQSTFGAWTASVLGAGAILLAGVAIVGAYQVSNSQKLDSHTTSLFELQRDQETANRHLDSLDKSLAVLADDVKQRARPH